MIKSDLIFTHDGVFHADEVLAVAMLKAFNTITAKVIRTRNMDLHLAQPESVCVDVFGVYDGHQYFDHHQDATLPASCELVRQALFVDGLISPELNGLIEPISKAVSHLDVNKDDIHKKLSSFNKNIDGDIYNLNSLIKGFNALEMGVEFQNQQFERAVEVCIYIIGNLVRQASLKAEYDAIWSRRDQYIGGYILDAFIPDWRERGAKRVIMPNPQGYALFTHDSEVLPLVDVRVEGLIFAHKGRFIAVYETLAQAKRAMLKQESHYVQNKFNSLTGEYGVFNAKYTVHKHTEYSHIGTCRFCGGKVMRPIYQIAETPEGEVGKWEFPFGYGECQDCGAI